MSSTSFTILPGPDPPDEDEERITRMIDRAFNAHRHDGSGTDADNGPRNPLNGPTEVVIPQIQNQFLRDPIGQLIDSILPQENPSDIQDWDEGEKINRMVQFEQNRKEKERIVAANALRQFAELVNSAVNISNNSSAAAGPVRIYVRPQDGGGGQRSAAAAVGGGAGAGGADAPLFSLDPTPEERRDYQYGQAVANALHRVEVTGEFTLSPEIKLGVENGLGSLFERDPSKFKNAVLEQFLGDAQAMRLMVRLCIAQINLERILFPTRYYKDGEESRRTAQINEICDMAARQLKRVSDGRYVAATEEEQREYLQRGREQLQYRSTKAHYHNKSVMGPKRAINRRRY